MLVGVLLGKFPELMDIDIGIKSRLGEVQGSTRGGKVPRFFCAYAEPFPWKLISVTNGRKVELHAFLNQEIHKIYKLRQRGWSHVPSFTAE